jgi:succinate dehydrogenase assembly factor 1
MGTDDVNCVGRDGFHKHRAVDKKDFGAIEYLVRRGRRQLEMYEEAGVRDVKS